MPTSKYIGVRAERNRWRADIQINKRKHFLGYFNSEIAAAQAYNNAIILHKLDRRLNQIDIK